MTWTLLHLFDKFSTQRRKCNWFWQHLLQDLSTEHSQPWTIKLSSKSCRTRFKLPFSRNYFEKCNFQWMRHHQFYCHVEPRLYRSTFLIRTLGTELSFWCCPQIPVRCCDPMQTFLLGLVCLKICKVVPNHLSNSKLVAFLLVLFWWHSHYEI